MAERSPSPPQRSYALRPDELLVLLAADRYDSLRLYLALNECDLGDARIYLDALEADQPGDLSNLNVVPVSFIAALDLVLSGHLRARYVALVEDETGELDELGAAEVAYQVWAATLTDKGRAALQDPTIAWPGSTEHHARYLEVALHPVLPEEADAPARTGLLPLDIDPGHASTLARALRFQATAHSMHPSEGLDGGSYEVGMLLRPASHHLPAARVIVVDAELDPALADARATHARLITRDQGASLHVTVYDGESDVEYATEAFTPEQLALAVLGDEGRHLPSLSGVMHAFLYEHNLGPWSGE